MFDLIIFAVLLGCGYFIGSQIEKKHYQDIEEREAKVLLLPAVTFKSLPDPRPVQLSRMVSGNVVISTDYFKLIVTGLRNIFGGKIVASESLVDRARREAILRLKSDAEGADIILNMRVETSRVQQGISIEAMAYGTAIYYQK